MVSYLVISSISIIDRRRSVGIVAKVINYSIVILSIFRIVPRFTYTSRNVLPYLKTRYPLLIAISKILDLKSATSYSLRITSR